MHSVRPIAAAIVAICTAQTAQAQSTTSYQQPTWQAGVGAAVGFHLGKIDYGRRRVHGTAHIYSEGALHLGARRYRDTAPRAIGGTALTYRSGKRPELEWTVRAGLGSLAIPAQGNAHFTFGRGSAELGVAWRPADDTVTPLIGLEARGLYLHGTYRRRVGGRHTLDAGLEGGLHIINLDESGLREAASR